MNDFAIYWSISMAHDRVFSYVLSFLKQLKKTIIALIITWSEKCKSLLVDCFTLFVIFLKQKTKALPYPIIEKKMPN
jgi:hypothetical protein